MIDVEEDHLNIVKQILRQFIPGIHVWVFGSRIKGTAKLYSDLDLVLLNKHKIPLTDFYKLKDAFEESVLPWRVDVLDWNRISPSFQKLIQHEHVVLL